MGEKRSRETWKIGTKFNLTVKKKKYPERKRDLQESERSWGGLTHGI